MSQWQVVNDEAEVKITNNVVMVRARGQKTEYPHTTVRIKNGEPDWMTLHHSDPANADRFGMREIIALAVQVALNL